MIDFHSHILPEIDDGSRSIEETYDMIKEAYEAGFTAIISTSHYIDGSYDCDKKTREELISRIEEGLKEKNIDIRIYNGAEAYVSRDLNLLVKENKLPTMNNSKYLLFELPMNTKVLFLEDAIYNLLSINVVPIIAHPERYSFVQENPNMLLDLIDKGVLFQMNYGSVSGLYGKEVKKTAIKLLKANMIHFLGSDAHRHHSIYSNMNELKSNIIKIIGEDKFKELSEENPNLVINNENIEIAEPAKIKRFFF